MIKFRGMKRNEMPELISLMKNIIPNIKYYPRKNLGIFLKDYSKKHLLDVFDHDDSVFLVAEEDRKFVGFLFGWREYGVFWIDWLGVDVHHRREHIATSLIRMAERQAKKMKCHKMHLDTSCTNFPAIHLYKKHGYFVESRLKKHWLKWNYDLISKYIGRSKTR